MLGLLRKVVVGAGVAVFGALGWLVGRGSLADVDLTISLGVQEAEAGLLESGMWAISAPGSAPLEVPLVLGLPALLWRLGHRLAGRFAILGALGALLGSAVLKSLWLRPRPSDELVEVIGDVPGSYSFPSGHTLLYTSFFGFLLYWSSTTLRRSRLRTLLVSVFGVLIGLIGVSRVYLGHHWASDVVASYALGLAWLLVVIQLYARARLSQPQTAA